MAFRFDEIFSIFHLVLESNSCDCQYNDILNFVVCSTDWELRLVNGGSSLEGRIEVCLNGVWGTICDNSWDDTDAGVVCSQMGYSRRG